jgi:hypothetical protein
MPNSYRQQNEPKMTVNPDPTDEHNEGSFIPDGFVVYRAASAQVHYLNPSASLIYDLIG